MRAGFSFSYPPISLLLGQPLSIKRAMQERYKLLFFSVCFSGDLYFFTKDGK
jgi:hypothetical protein